MVFDLLDVGDIVLLIGRVQLVPYPDDDGGTWRLSAP
jgi:hypothetical protein